MNYKHDIFAFNHSTHVDTFYIVNSNAVYRMT